jgi:transcriptional regulator with XRE-family HTH domain
MFMDGRIVRIIRYYNGFNQRELSDRMSCSIPYISQIESGERNLSKQFLDSFCSAIGMEKDKLFLFEDVLTILDKREDLTDRQKEIIALSVFFELDKLAEPSRKQINGRLLRGK